LAAYKNTKTDGLIKRGIQENKRGYIAGLREKFGLKNNAEKGEQTRSDRQVYKTNTKDVLRAELDGLIASPPWWLFPESFKGKRNRRLTVKR
jgi:hypothetical protein